MESIYISYPIYRYPEPESEACLEKVIVELSQKGYRIGLDRVRGESLISRARNRSISRFIKDGTFDWFFSIDSDIVFDKDLGERLLSHNKEFIGAIYRVKDNSKAVSSSVPIEADGAPWKNKTMDMYAGLQEMMYLSSGCMMINRTVVKDLMDAYPDLEYQDDYSDESVWGFYVPIIVDYYGTKRYLSEDWALCYRARKAGIKLYADTDIKLGHMHMTPLTFKEGEKKE
jgi:hypothetical protein